MIHGVNASGLSAFNPGERRMAPLSRLLTGVLLRHDIHGTHLDSSGKTIDLALEIRNFFAIGKLCNIGHQNVLDCICDERRKAKDLIALTRLLNSQADTLCSYKLF